MGIAGFWKPEIPDCPGPAEFAATLASGEGVTLPTFASTREDLIWSGFRSGSLCFWLSVNHAGGREPLPVAPLLAPVEAGAGGAGGSTAGFAVDADCVPDAGALFVVAPVLGAGIPFAAAAAPVPLGVGSSVVCPGCLVLAINGLLQIRSQADFFSAGLLSLHVWHVVAAVPAEGPVTHG